MITAIATLAPKASAPPTSINYGQLTVKDWMGSTPLATGALTGPSEPVVVLTGATDFASGVARARSIVNVDDPGTQAIVDAGNGVIELRQLDQRGPAGELASKSFGGAEISDPQNGLLGIFNFAHDVPVTS